MRLGSLFRTTRIAFVSGLQNISACGSIIAFQSVNRRSFHVTAQIALSIERVRV